MALTSDPEIQPCAHFTPYSAWINGDANIKHLVKFGSPAWMHLHGASKYASKPTSKIDPKAKKVHVVGYQGSHIYVIWDPEINQLRDTSNILIKEEFSPPQNKLYKATKAAKTIKATKAAEPKTNGKPSYTGYIRHYLQRRAIPTCQRICYPKIY
jgi:hypothetical protein